jgi:glycosyltransferase involved in cell wall biosynthesis
MSSARTPAVSVILPTYNRAASLPRAIETVLAQTYRDLELVVVDDGSTDDTESVVSKVRDDRVSYVKIATNRGLSAARNAGLVDARGTYFAFQDSDDEWLADKLAKQMRVMGGRADTIVYCDMYRVRSDRWVFYHRSPAIVRGRVLNPETGYWQPYMLASQATLIPRACLDSVGMFDEGLVAFEDLDLFLRASRLYEFVHLEEPLVNYYASEGLTTDRRAELVSRLGLLRRHFAHALLEDPMFPLRELLGIALKRSLLPIVDLHLRPLDRSRRAPLILPLQKH